MKMRIMMAAVLAMLTVSCASGPKNEEFKSGIADCAMMCKASPEIKEYSQSQGGGFFLFIFGSEEKKCSCSR